MSIFFSRKQGATKTKDSMSGLYKLFGIPSSLYTAKVRSYLRKQAIPFVETGPWDPQYQQEVLPQIGRMIMPERNTKRVSFSL